MRHRQTILSVLVLVLIVGTAGQLHAADCNFRYGDGNWSNAALWENGVPDASKSALMRRVATLDEDANCSSLEFGLTYGTEIGAVVVSANNTLTVGGAANLIGYQAYITQSDGTIAFGGELNMSTREFDTSIDVSGGQLTASAMSLGRQAPPAKFPSPHSRRAAGRSQPPVTPTSPETPAATGPSSPSPAARSTAAATSR